MLHILFLILKIIGIILAVILGLVLLLVLIVLFVPIRYYVDGQTEGDLKESKATVRITWFLGLLKIKAELHGKKLTYSAKVAFKTIIDSEKDESDQQEDDIEEELIALEKELEDEEDIPSQTEEAAEDKTSDQREDTQVVEPKPEPVEDRKETAESSKGRKKESTGSRTDQEKPKEKVGIKQKIKKFADKVKRAYSSGQKKTEELITKKDKLEGFITEDAHVHTLKLALAELLKLLKRILPRKYNMYLHYGFEDPYYTGLVLAIASMLYPVLAGNAEIIPEFEKKVMEGNVNIKGRILIAWIVSMLLKLVLCKDARRTYKDFRNFKL